MSASTTPTDRPRRARSTATLTVTDDFPTPPLPDATAYTRVRDPGLANGISAAGASPRSFWRSSVRCASVITPRLTTAPVTPGIAETAAVTSRFNCSRIGQPATVSRTPTRTRPSAAVSTAYYLGCGGKAPPHHGETWVSNPADAGGSPHRPALLAVLLAPTAAGIFAITGPAVMASTPRRYDGSVTPRFTIADQWHRAPATSSPLSARNTLTDPQPSLSNPDSAQRSSPARIAALAAGAPSEKIRCWTLSQSTSRSAANPAGAGSASPGSSWGLHAGQPVRFIP